MASSVIFGVMMLVCAVTAANTLRMRRDKTCPCPMNYMPVCGSDDITYPNKCALECQESVQKVSEGACQTTKKKRSACPCPRNIDYVCGTNGETYDNQCLMECADAEFSHMGQC